jgi:hypothetical protein
MKPMPMGRVGEVGNPVEESRERVVERWDSRSETSVPAPMKPMPPEGRS